MGLGVPVFDRFSLKVNWRIIPYLYTKATKTKTILLIMPRALVGHSQTECAED
jgi:hypothetical protein